MSRAGRGLLLAAILAGCGVADQPTNTAKVGAQFVPDAQGLAVVGSRLRIDFGRAPSGVIAALDRELGTGAALGVDGCPGDIRDQRNWNGLVLSFTAERFVGWRTPDGRAGQTCG